MKYFFCKEGERGFVEKRGFQGAPGAFLQQACPFPFERKEGEEREKRGNKSTVNNLSVSGGGVAAHIRRPKGRLPFVGIQWQFLALKLCANLFPSISPARKSSMFPAELP
jgi:hypothetical protein